MTSVAAEFDERGLIFFIQAVSGKMEVHRQLYLYSEKDKKQKMNFINFLLFFLASFY